MNPILSRFPTRLRSIAAICSGVLGWAGAAGSLDAQVRLPGATAPLGGGGPGMAVSPTVRGEKLVPAAMNVITDKQGNSWNLEQNGNLGRVGNSMVNSGLTLLLNNQQFYTYQPMMTADGKEFDRLFEDGETFALGELELRVLHTPGHTNDSVTYLVGNAAFVGDTVFMTDFGTARCDSPGGDAGLLYDSVKKLYALPDDTIFYLCHDYPPSERELRHAVPIAEQRAENVHINDAVTRDSFIRMRNERDATLKPPLLVLPSLQVNIRAGHLPEPDDNGTVYLRIPVDTI